MSLIKTRLLIISDTHGAVPAAEIPRQKLDATLAKASDPLALGDWTPWDVPPAFRGPLFGQDVDVLVHCGDLTAYSVPAEFAKTLAFLRRHPAPLKLVIPGNHDYALAPTEWPADLPPELNDHKTVMKMFDDARADGVVLLAEEGTYDLVLQNGAALKVYASAWTPRHGCGAFQYQVGPSAPPHGFAVPAGVDLAVTHGPPRGVLDSLKSGTHVGSLTLWQAVARARPRISCFGHIHESWGCHLVRWRADAAAGSDEWADQVDEAHSLVIAGDKMVKPTNKDPESVLAEKQKRWHQIVADGKVHVDLEDERWKTASEQQQTLFINASVMDVTNCPLNAPWVIDLVLPLAASKTEREPSAD